jgi:hypothetical protein
MVAVGNYSVTTTTHRIPVLSLGRKSSGHLKQAAIYSLVCILVKKFSHKEVLPEYFHRGNDVTNKEMTNPVGMTGTVGTASGKKCGTGNDMVCCHCETGEASRSNL